MTALMDDPFGAMERSIQDADRCRAETQAKKDEEKRLEAAWDAVIQAPDMDLLMNLSQMLVSHGQRLWIDYLRADLFRNSELNPGNYYLETYNFAATLKMFDAAFRDDRDMLWGLLAKAKELSMHFNWGSSFTEARDRIGFWAQGGQLPHTPYVLRKELVAALRGLTGLSNSSISRREHDGVLKKIDEHGDYAKYRHENQDTHRQVLSRVVAYVNGKISVSGTPTFISPEG